MFDIIIWCLASIFDVYNQNFSIENEHIDFRSQYLTSAVKKIEVSIKYLAQFVKNWLTPSKFDVQEYLTTQVKFWRNKCVLPKWWDALMTSKFDVRVKFWQGAVKFGQKLQFLAMLILMNVFTLLVIAHFPIDHMIWIRIHLFAHSQIISNSIPKPILEFPWNGNQYRYQYCTMDNFWVWETIFLLFCRRALSSILVSPW